MSQRLMHTLTAKSWLLFITVSISEYLSCWSAMPKALPPVSGLQCKAQEPGEDMSFAQITYLLRGGSGTWTYLPDTSLCLPIDCLACRNLPPDFRLISSHFLKVLDLRQSDSFAAHCFLSCVSLLSPKP